MPISPAPGWVVALTAAASLALAGCGAPVKLHDVPAAKTVNAPKQKSELASVSFTRVGADIPRGRVIGSMYYNPLGCAYTTTPELTWSSSRYLSNDIEFKDTFFKVFDTAGFNVLGRPDQLFETVDTRQRATYQIGAQIKDLRINACAEKDFWTGAWTDRFSGEASAVVDWQVFSNLNRRIVLRAQTTGKAKLERPLPDGARVLVVDAFSNAAENLAADEKLLALLTRDERQEARTVAAGYGPIEIPKIRESTTPIAERMRQVIDATVAILLGGGHGSGFLVSRDGYILTNNHVVGDAKNVKVQLSTGLRVDGEVLRRDPYRDVALVKIPASLDHPLPIRARNVPRVGEEVYVVGAPLRENLQSTVTRGIVSALRHNEHAGRIIQSDATIHGGNSGGPMLDKYGNVVGLSVASYVDSETGAGAPGLNIFVPIDDALEKLKIGLATRSVR